VVSRTITLPAIRPPRARTSNLPACAQSITANRPVIDITTALQSSNMPVCWDWRTGRRRVEAARYPESRGFPARGRNRAEGGKCEGRKSWGEINPDLVREAKRLCRRSPKGINASPSPRGEL
jgi:hypothetical protein